jgi:hypothetical protein
VLALCGLLGESARHSVVAAALTVDELLLAHTLDALESLGYVYCEDGLLRVSGLMADATRQRIKASIGRLDASNASGFVERSWLDTRDTRDFYSVVRLRIAAKEEATAGRFLDAEVGTLVRTESATSLVFELRRLRDVASTSQLTSVIDSTIQQILEGAESKRRVARAGNRALRVSSLPDVSPGAIEKQYSLANPNLLAESQRASRDPSLPPSQRLCEAVEAMFVASNTDNDAGMTAAFDSVNAIRHSTEINPFDLYRADLMYYAGIADRENALRSSELLVGESRLVRDVGLACRGLRNAAEGFASFGFVDRAQSLLLESRALASRLAYESSVVYADLRLADLAIHEMDTTGAYRYLSSAEENAARHGLRIPILRADYFQLSCWAAILLGDIAAATKASHGMVRTVRKQSIGAAHAAVTGTRLATHRGSATLELTRGFDALCEGLLRRNHNCNKEFSLAAVILYSNRIGRASEAAALAESVMKELVRHGRHPWPFLDRLLAQ